MRPNLDGKVFHRLTDRGGVGVEDRFVFDVICPKRSDQRHTLGGAERQIEAVHAARSQPATALAVGGATP